MNRTILTCLLLCACLWLVAGCGSSAEQAALPGQLKAWIDAPLDRMTLPLAPYEIVCHGTDPGGIARMELTINDTTETDEAVEVEGPLTTMRHKWTPPGPGTYVIKARAQNQSGQWSAADTVTVLVVAAGMAPTTTTTPGTSVTTPAGSAGTTTTPAGGNQPQTPEGGTTFSVPQLSTSNFYYAYCGSSPLQVTINVSVSDSAGINSVEIHYRLRNKTTGQLSSWFDRQMTSAGGSYQVTLKAENDFNLSFLGYGSMVEYQFLATNSNGIASQSALYDDLSLTGCGARVPPR